MNKDNLSSLWNSLSSSKLSEILDLMFLCLVNFEYKVRVVIKILTRPRYGCVHVVLLGY